MSDELFLIDDEPQNNKTSESWKILVVDDEESVHTITNVALSKKIIDNKKLEILNAMSAKEAKVLLHEHDDIALAIIDVVMETPESGLELIEYIRNEMKNKTIRLVLRTGQPSQAPEEHVINFYDINDYKEKTELTIQKLYTLLRTSIKQYTQFRELQDSRDAIYKKMTTFELTGLPNRMKLNECLDLEGKKSLVLINIDDFSRINETQGFEVGDKLLQAFAKHLDDRYKEKMQIFHLNSDIFALLCTELDKKDVHECMNDLKLYVRNHHFNIESNSFHLTVSIGIVLQESGNIIQKAELAIKEARSIGKNNTQVYADDLNIIRTIHSNSLWSERVHFAIKEKKLFAYFQAIQNFNTGKIEKYEALVRMEHEGTIYTPADFLEAAIFSGQSFDIFQVMFKSICLKAQKSYFDFSVNVSEFDLKDINFVDFIKQTLLEYDVEANRITLEILEYKSISHEKGLKDMINGLHDFGLKISIDDFGSHCSNFSQLNNLDIDFIKIDGSFIKNIVTCKDSQIVARTIIKYAHQKNIPVIAEFVCDEDVYNYVKEMNTDYAQGYYVGKPDKDLME